MRLLRLITIASAIALPVFLLACADDDEDPVMREDLRLKHDLQILLEVPYPPDNQPEGARPHVYPARVELGRMLFFDPLLSGRKDTACATCHHPAWAWGDGRNRAIGVAGEGLGPDRIVPDPLDQFLFDETPRNSPTCLNAGCSAQPEGEPHYLGLQFWDGRADGLEEQSKLPIASKNEMAAGIWSARAAMDSVLARLREFPGYVDLFRDAFPDEADEMDLWPGVDDRHVIREDTYARAMGAYQRELVALEDSPYDRYVRGYDWALSEAEFRGLDLFFGKAGCAECHDGPMFSSYEFSVTGVAQAGPGRDDPGDGLDHGRWEHSDDEIQRFAFRVPTLRNVELTGPYFRTGEVASLREVIEFYNVGSVVLPTGYEDQQWRFDPRLELDGLGLSSEEMDDLEAFLRALSDRTIDSPVVDPTVPQSLPSGLEPPGKDLAPFELVPPQSSP